MADRPDIESGHLTAAHVAMLLDRAADDLTRRLGDVFSPETIREVVQQSYDLLDATAQVRTTCPCWLAASPATACRPYRATDPAPGQHQRRSETKPLDIPRDVQGRPQWSVERLCCRILGT